MYALKYTTFAFFLVAVLSLAWQGDECKEVETVNPFDLDEYISAFWYVQQQATTSYQPESNLFCVRAKYVKTSNTTLDVYNFARQNSVEGAPLGINMILKAFVPDPAEAPAKLKVGPRWLPWFLYGDYWVVAFEANSWAIVSGGAPSVPSGANDGTCSTGGRWALWSGGLWLFTREKVGSPEAITTMRERAQSLGYDLSVLKDVAQQGCEYEII